MKTASDPSVPGARWWSMLAVGVALAVLTVIQYGASVQAGFSGDDWGLLDQASAGFGPQFGFSGYHYNPIPILLRLWFYHFFGLNAVPYHIADLGMYWLCSVVILVVASYLTGKRSVGVLAAFLWVTYGAHYEVAVWSVVSFQQLPAIACYVGGFGLYLRAQDMRLEARQRHRAYAAFLAAFIVCPFIYEPAVTLIGVCALYRLCHLERQEPGKGGPWPRRLARMVLYVLRVFRQLQDLGLPLALFAAYLIFKAWYANLVGAAQLPALNEPMAVHAAQLAQGIFRAFIPGVGASQANAWSFASTSSVLVWRALVAQVVVLGLVVALSRPLYRFLLLWTLLQVVAISLSIGDIQPRHLAIIVIPTAMAYACAFVALGDAAVRWLMHAGVNRARAVPVGIVVTLALASMWIVVGMRHAMAETQDWDRAAAREYRIIGQVDAYIRATPSATKIMLIDLPPVALSRSGEFDYMFLNATSNIVSLKHRGRFEQIIVARTEGSVDWGDATAQTPEQIRQFSGQRGALTLEYDAHAGTIRA